MSSPEVPSLGQPSLVLLLHSRQLRKLVSVAGAQQCQARQCWSSWYPLRSWVGKASPVELVGCKQEVLVLWGSLTVQRHPVHVGVLAKGYWSNPSPKEQRPPSHWVPVPSSRGLIPGTALGCPFCLPRAVLHLSFPPATPSPAVASHTGSFLFPMPPGAGIGGVAGVGVPGGLGVSPGKEIPLIPSIAEPGADPSPCLPQCAGADEGLRGCLLPAGAVVPGVVQPGVGAAVKPPKVPGRCMAPELGAGEVGEWLLLGAHHCLSLAWQALGFLELSQAVCFLAQVSWGSPTYQQHPNPRGGPHPVPAFLFESTALWLGGHCSTSPACPAAGFLQPLAACLLNSLPAPSLLPVLSKPFRWGHSDISTVPKAGKPSVSGGLVSSSMGAGGISTGRGAGTGHARTGLPSQRLCGKKGEVGGGEGGILY